MNTVFTCKFQTYTTFLVVNGVEHAIRFVPKGAPYKHGCYVCTDENVAKALHKHPSYGTIFVEESTGMIADRPAELLKEKNYIASYPEVTKSQEAIAILVDKHGVDADSLKSLKNKAAVKEAAEKLNISFSNL